MARIFILAVFVACSLAAMADDGDIPRRWAVIAGGNLSCPTISNSDKPKAGDNTASFGGLTGGVLLEYYLPNPHFC